jgi:uncharacterized protein Smg (DUF494 family)
MKTNFNITQDEKSRILEMHENRTKYLYLTEQNNTKNVADNIKKTLSSNYVSKNDLNQVTNTINNLPNNQKNELIYYYGNDILKQLDSVGYWTDDTKKSKDTLVNLIKSNKTTSAPSTQKSTPASSPTTPQIDQKRFQQLNNFYKLTYNNTINLQKKLNSLGYQLKEDGVLGKNTYNALMRILDSQQNKDIKPIEAAKPKELPIQQNQQSVSTVNVPAK